MFKPWKEKVVVVTIGKLTWYPVDGSVVSRGSFAITDKMRNNKHEMSMIVVLFLL